MGYEGTRLVFDRVRPPLPYMIEPNGGFPSGHAADAVLYTGLLVYFIWPELRRRRLAMALAVCYVLGIGFSRVFLEAHYMTDVAAGFCLGGSVLLLAVCWLHQTDPLKARDAFRPTTSARRATTVR